MDNAKRKNMLLGWKKDSYFIIIGIVILSIVIVGLQLVITLVEQLEGRIELDNSVGTTFKIAFPELMHNEGG